MPGQRRRGHQRGLDLRLLSLVAVRKLVEQQVRDDEPEDGVAQELERLVVADAPADVLVGARRVGHRVLEQAAVAEAVADRQLQRLELVAQPHHPAVGQLGAVLLDDALRLLGVGLVDGDADFAQRIDGHREQRLRERRRDDRRHAMCLEKPAHDARFDVGPRPEDGDQVSHVR